MADLNSNQSTYHSSPSPYHQSTVSPYPDQSPPPIGLSPQLLLPPTSPSSISAPGSTQINPPHQQNVSGTTLPVPSIELPAGADPASLKRYFYRRPTKLSNVYSVDDEEGGGGAKADDPNDINIKMLRLLVFVCLVFYLVLAYYYSPTFMSKVVAFLVGLALLCGACFLLMFCRSSSSSSPVGVKKV